jgi:uncharacterized protein YkwD
MRKMKNTLAALLLPSAVVISLAACSTNAVSTTDSTEIESTFSTPVMNEDAEETGMSVSDNDTDHTTVEQDIDTPQMSGETPTTAAETTAEKDPAPESPSGDADAAVETTTAAQTQAVPPTTMATTMAKTPTTVPPTTAAAVVKPVSISASVTGTHYGGETLTGADFNVTVTFSDGTSATNPAGFTASPLTLVTGSNSIVVAYNSVSTTITVNGKEKGTAAPTTAVQPTTAAPTTAAPTTTASTQITIPNGIIDEIGRQAFTIQNQYRSEAGVGQLTWSNELYAIACIRAEEIVSDFSHSGSITNGENIHYGTFWGTYASEELYQQALSDRAALIMQGWKNSSGHYKTMTKAKYQYGAIACYKYDSVEFSVAVFSEYDGFGEYEDKDCVVDHVIYNAIQNGTLRLNASSEYAMGEPVSVFRIDYVKLFWYPKQIPNVAGLFNNMTFGDYCNSIGKYQ